MFDHLPPLNHMYPSPKPPSLLSKEGGLTHCITCSIPLFAKQRGGQKGVSTCDPEAERGTKGGECNPAILQSFRSPALCG